MKEIEKLKEELYFIMKELTIQHTEMVRAFRKKHYNHVSTYNELNGRRKNILNKLNQLRLKYWYWK